MANNSAGQLLYGRVSALLVGPAGGEGKTWSTTPDSGLRLHFKVTKTGDSAPNKAEITIYNLSAESRHHVSSLNPKTWAVQLSAGYEATGSHLLFTGNLALASSAKSAHGADWLTHIEGRDGLHAYRAVVVAKSFGPSTSQESVVHAVAKAMGVAIGTIKFPKGAKFGHGRALCGPAVRELDALCRSHKLRWSIQDGVLQILPLGEALDLEAFVIGPETGMVGSPERTETGVKVKMLLQGAMNPGRLIQLKSRDLAGLYVAENVDHEGDTHGDVWYTIVDAFRAS